MTLSASPDRVSEDAGATAITVTAALNGQRSLARDTQVQLALEGGTATADDDYEPATALLTIPAGRMSASATLTLTPVDDTVWEGNETVTIAGSGRRPVGDARRVDHHRRRCRSHRRDPDAGARRGRRSERARRI